MGRVETSRQPSVSLEQAIGYLGKRVTVVMDRPYGSRHPVHGYRYTVNYGYLPGTGAPDGEELDAYYLGPAGPVDVAEGTCVAIVHRLTDDDDKLVVVGDGHNPSDDEILTAVAFQELPGQHELIRTATDPIRSDPVGRVSASSTCPLAGRSWAQIYPDPFFRRAHAATPHHSPRLPQPPCRRVRPDGVLLTR